MAQPKKIIDTSYWNDYHDWDKVNAQVDGVAMRATWKSFIDPTCAPGLDEATARNMRIMQYHFYQPDTECSIQLNTFLNFYLSQKYKTAIAIDCEEVDYTDANGRKVVILPPSKEKYTTWVMQWLIGVETVTKQIPSIYTRKSFWDQWVLTPTGWDWTHYPLWVANYGVSSPILPKPWLKAGYKLWQYRSDDAVDGLVGAVDANKFNGSVEDLDRYMPRPNAVPMPLPPPPLPIPLPPPGGYSVHLGSNCYALTVRSGPGKGYNDTNKYLVNSEYPKPSKATYLILEEKNGFGRIDQPYAGWVGLFYTVKA